MFKTAFYICFICSLISNNSNAQRKLNFGISGGITASNAQLLDNNVYGKLKTGYGFNFYIPINYYLHTIKGKKRDRQISIESGIGYYCNRYKFIYNNSVNGSSNLHPYIPVKLRITKVTRLGIDVFTSIGCTFDFYPVKTTFSAVDSVTGIVCITDLKGKANQYATIEFGIRRIKFLKQTHPVRSPGFHQLSVQFNYGFQTVTEGVGYNYKITNSNTRYNYKGHFLSVNYCYWFGRKNKVLRMSITPTW